MLHVRDVIEERTWSEEQEEDDEVHSLPTDGAVGPTQEDIPEAPPDDTNDDNATLDEPPVVSPPASLTVAHSSTTTIIKHQDSENSRRRPKFSGRGGRRMLRRIRRAVAKLFAHDLPLLRAPETIRAMPLRTRINFYLSNPEESNIGWRLQQLLMVLLIINVCAMASETVDGPRFGSTDPGYPYMPGDSTFIAVEVLFSLFFVFEFVVRWVTAPNQSLFWKSVPTWITLLAAIAALPRLFLLAAGADTAFADTFMFNLRILRAIRLIVLAYAYVGTKVLFQAAVNSIAPLTITLFFLVTVVMVFATAIFYAEPCYDLKTCTFTDILNTGYFVMLTVATVGYGSQVPSLHNAGSLILVCIVMIFGTVYFSMPLAIIGVKYELAWAEYEEYADNLKLTQQNLPQRKKRSSKLSADMSRRQIINALAGRTTDDELEKIEAHTMKYASSNTCDRFYLLSQAILEVNASLQHIVCPPATATDIPTTLEAVIQSTKRRSDEASQALDGVMSVIKLHTRVCSEAHELLLALKSPLPEHETDLDRYLSSGKFTSKGMHTFGSHSISRVNRAKGALVALGAKAVKAISHHDHHVDPKSLQAEIWNIFEYRHDTPIARAVNKVRMYTIVLSIAVFYLQTTSELQNTGVRTFLCQRNIHAFCDRYDDPGCYVFKEVSGTGSGLSVEVTEQIVDFDCEIGDADESCYASGVNFGSENFPLSCSDVFPSGPGVTYVCNSRLCNPPVQFMFDMEPYWIYFEFLFGFLFTVEMALRVYAHPVRRHIWGDLKVLASIAILIPFYVEVVEIMMGEWPTYSVVPTLPSFFSMVRFLKSLRILKLGSHIPGSRVLIRTAQLTVERLAIPFFFLFLGCVVSAAVFFELERGTECFVGKSCMWWSKNVLTAEMSEGLPIGKRILVQNTLVTMMTDMLHSTWFSLVSFTTVGYGDLYPRTSLGKMVDIVGMIFSSCYTAMPLTLVGGQFYICYELYAQEKMLKKRRAQKQIKPDESSAMVRSLMHAFPSTREKSEKIEEEVPSESTQDDQARTDSQAVIDPVETFRLPSLSTRTVSASSAPSTDRPEDVSKQQYTHSTEIQIINHFFLMQKVFNETIKDISLLNRLGIERVNIMRKNSSEAAAQLADRRECEMVVEAKLAENMDFCVTACLNFAAIIDRTLGTQRTTSKSQRPSIVQTNALLAVAEVTAELLQKQSAKTPSARSSGRKKTVAAAAEGMNGSATVSSTTTGARPKRNSFRRIATLSKIFVGPILQKGEHHHRSPKWAEYTNKKNEHEESIPE